MKKIGIIVARFQVPILHSGHLHLIREAIKQSDLLVIFLVHSISGSSPIDLTFSRCPFRKVNQVHYECLIYHSLVLFFFFIIIII